jgi:hypothetical protein
VRYGLDLYIIFRRNSPSPQRGCYTRIMTATVQLKKRLAMSLKRLGAKTN